MHLPLLVRILLSVLISFLHLHHFSSTPNDTVVNLGWHGILTALTAAIWFY